MFTNIMATRNPSWLSIGEAAKYLGISRDTLRRWEQKGKIKPVRSPSNRRYYTTNQLAQIRQGNQPLAQTNQPKSLITNRLKKHELILLGVFVLVLTLLAVVFALYLFV